MTDFAAIDFETANYCSTSACSIGVIIVKNGKIVDKFYSNIQPVPNYYNYRCTQVHGMTRKDTDNAPIFPIVWNQIKKLIGNLPLVAHNKTFDEKCLLSILNYYEIEHPEFQFHCTYKAARKAFPNAENHQLHTIAKLCGYNIENHHHALADAEACAHIALEIL